VHEGGELLACALQAQAAHRLMPAWRGLSASRLPGTACADAARREVHHAQEGVVVLRVGGQAQVGQGVLDLGALEEAQAAVDPVGNAGGEQGVFDAARLGVGAVQHGHVVPRRPSRLQGLDFLHHEARFLAVVVGLEMADRLALAGVGPQVLAQAVLVVGDHRIGGVEDGRVER
jgi:hypothetical protein